jgi:Holliday junction resolvasome RuvABC endonuclease subunit
MGSYRSLLAVDPSLTCSGWALFSIFDGRIRSVGKVRSDPPSVPMGQRLKSLQERIEAVLERIDLGERDLLVCEAATTVKDPHNALKVENVRSIFETVAREREVTVPGRINPRSVHYEIMGLKGKQLPRADVKQAAVRTVQCLYADQLIGLGLGVNGLSRHQDIVDAILIGRLALTRISAAKSASFAIEDVFAHKEGQRRGSWRVRSGVTS